MPPSQRARSDAYFEGGYWLQLWDFLSTVSRCGCCCGSVGRRGCASWPSASPVSVAANGALLDSVHSRRVSAHFPPRRYEGYFREHKYGLLNQTFGPWMGEQMLSLAVSVVLGAILVVPLFGLVRRLGKNWWVWGATLTIVFAAFVSLIAPVYIAPLFNKYTTVQDARNQGPDSQHGARERNSGNRRLRVRCVAAVESGKRQRQRVCRNIAHFAERQSA